MALLAIQVENNAKQRGNDAREKGIEDDNKTLTHIIQALAWIPKLLVKASDVAGAGSQGGLLLIRGLEGVKFSQTYIGQDGKPKQRDLRIEISGGPVDAKEAHRIMIGAGFKDDRKRVFQINRLEEKTIGGYYKTDFVADVLGGNAQYSENPRAYQLGGWFSFPALMTDKSPHSNYSCSVCEYDKLSGINKQVRDRFTNPTLIDKDGNFRKRD